jgi:hypothetical protein
VIWGRRGREREDRNSEIDAGKVEIGGEQVEEEDKRKRGEAKGTEEQRWDELGCELHASSARPVMAITEGSSRSIPQAAWGAR